MAAHARLNAPIVLVWDRLGRHHVPQMQTFFAQQQWLTVFQLPAYAPDLNPAEGIWSLLKHGVLANVALANLVHLVRIVKRGLNQIQNRPHLIDGCLAETRLVLTPP
ncbi:transposase [Streptomyces decoyicus]|uniref:transposase n=1 Tax=Streptomyces decoyicus TaxID=249567 RepID=UPI00386EB01F|nr:transposase [Streptomyces decoyicus]